MNPIVPERHLLEKLSSGLTSWLDYERLCGRERVFSEKYMTRPLAELLAHHFRADVEAEHNHPVLQIPGRRGRPPQIDFVVRHNNQITVAVESKWLGKSGLNAPEVVWDCVRLELAAHHYSCDALFVLAGRRDEIDELLATPGFNPPNSRGRTSRLLGINFNGRISINIQSNTRAFGPALHAYLRDYPSVNFPRSIVCGTGIQAESARKSEAYTAVVWHIRPEASIKRYVFKAKPIGATPE
jgi:hypothetical protein